MRTAYFHEDDYCQWEVLPIEANDFCLKQMGKIKDFAEEHEFNDIYVREESKHTIGELNLSKYNLDEVLDFLPAYDKVETGYASYREECSNTFCRGLGPYTNVFWSVDKSGVVNAIWLDIWLTTENQDIWRKILTALGKMSSVLMADWGWKQCVNLASTEEIDNYIKVKMENNLT